MTFIEWLHGWPLWAKVIGVIYFVALCYGANEIRTAPRRDDWSDADERLDAAEKSEHERRKRERNERRRNRGTV